ncbi:hypothetical protein PoB_001822100 [Plakobranchus ocellatus]|uniref:DUF6729 domain-containing protein n=1 Tax=Plakobranchus ocellatus TaxID=259542 RepID=A0AAV3YX82_9GAST|nr:hypothetical protein PoB_001822100 [Plakobranchus ocellatus]
MPYRIWGTRFHCTKPDCRRQQLVSCGLYKTVRRVIDLSNDYYMGAEYLECGKCHKKLPSWSMDILDQLDPAHRSYFPAVLTYHLALDKRVVALVKDRSLGNSTTQLARKLQEKHTHDYLERKLRYFSTVGKLLQQMPGMKIKDCPPYRPSPSPKWLLSVYVTDVFSRLEGLKSAITSTLGKILKMDSTKRVTKKLTGTGSRTAAWLTNVGNEHGHVK